jgi:DNA-directed RNA polymerase subunit H (RpoH/RPB5)
MAQSNATIEVFKSRKNILDCLAIQDYDISKYNNFNIHEVNSMLVASQLDMLVKNERTEQQTYVKYHLGKSLRPTNIYEFVEDLFNLEEVLKKSDNLVIIIKDEPNETIQKTLKTIWEQDNIYVIVINIKRLQYNILDHKLVPPHIPLNAEEEQRFREKYNITDNSQIPDISRFSPVAQVIGLRPGQICRIIRPSKTAINADFYRICM